MAGACMPVEFNKLTAGSQSWQRAAAKLSD